MESSTIGDQPIFSVLTTVQMNKARAQTSVFRDDAIMAGFRKGAIEGG